MGGIQPENPFQCISFFSFMQVLRCVRARGCLHLVTSSKAVTVNLAGTYLKRYSDSKQKEKKKPIIYVDLTFPEGLETASIAFWLFWGYCIKENNI